MGSFPVGISCCEFLLKSALDYLLHLSTAMKETRGFNQNFLSRFPQVRHSSRHLAFSHTQVYGGTLMLSPPPGEQPRLTDPHILGPAPSLAFNNPELKLLVASAGRLIQTDRKQL